MSALQGSALSTRNASRDLFAVTCCDTHAALDADTLPLPIAPSPLAMQPHRRPQPLRPLPMHVMHTTGGAPVGLPHEKALQPLQIANCHGLLANNTVSHTINGKAGCSSCTSTSSSQSSQGVSTQPVTPSSTSSAAKAATSTTSRTFSSRDDKNAKDNASVEASAVKAATSVAPLVPHTAMLRQIKRPVLPVRVPEPDTTHAPPVRHVFTRHTLLSPRGATTTTTTTSVASVSPQGSPSRYHKTGPTAAAVKHEAAARDTPAPSSTDAQRLRVFALLRATYAELDRDVMHPTAARLPTPLTSARGKGSPLLLQQLPSAQVASGSVLGEAEDASAEDMEQRRVMWLQQQHHDMEIIRNGGHETVRPGMRSSANLANSLVRLRARHSMERMRGGHSMNSSSMLSHHAGSHEGNTSLVMSSAHDSVLDDGERDALRKGRAHEESEGGSYVTSLVLSPQEKSANEVVRQAWGVHSASNNYNNNQSGTTAAAALVSPCPSFLQDASVELGESRPCTTQGGGDGRAGQQRMRSRRYNTTGHKAEAVVILPLARDEEDEEGDEDEQSGATGTRFGKHKPHYDQDMSSNSNNNHGSNSNSSSSSGSNASSARLYSTRHRAGRTHKLTHACGGSDEDEDEVLFSFTSCRKQSVYQRSEPSCSPSTTIVAAAAAAQDVITVEELENSPEPNAQGSRLYTVKKLFGMLDASSVAEPKKSKEGEVSAERKKCGGTSSSSSSEDDEPMLSMQSFRRSSIHRLNEHHE